ncbi:PAS domain-containing sensor histidine kinase [Peribacillus cavernae]|uniref:histidine kinase n=1 Tax=Peribacillus cavernae TaxID=1674310 RepID=A0A433HPJ1_9BACI|nr:PAS domain-containing sensor histidine kinase [Peribacillus cavernae]MDQ0217293.1 two-component system, sporulation sensor kinase E [Peribacillus cavernae]RUQ30241.1 PAS domain-containing sensor histidine kinase [Peribacillus cavernae]
MYTDLEAISSYKKEIDKLNSKIEQFTDLIDHTFEALIEVNDNKKILYANLEACLLLNVSKEDILTSKLSDFLWNIPEDVLSYQDKMIVEKGTYKDEWIVQLSSGEKKQVEFIGFSYGNREKIAYKLRDVTAERVHMQERIMTTQMFLDVFNKAVDCIVIYDKQGVIIDANDAFCKTLILDKPELVGKKIQDFIPISQQNTWKRSLEKVLSSGTSTGEIEMNPAGGKIRFEYSTSSNIFNKLNMSIFRNVTEKEIIEKKLKKSEQIFSELFDQTMDAIVFWDENGVIFRVNDSACKIFESKREHLLGRHISTYVHKKDKRFKAMVSAFHQKGEVRDELLYKMANGQIKLLELTSKMHSSEGYNITIFRNVSERWRIEKELRKSEKKFRKIFEGSLDGMILWNQTNFADINEIGANILELTKEKLLSTTVDEILEKIPENTSKLNSHIENVMQIGMDKTIIPITFGHGKIKYLEFSTRKNLYSDLHLTIFRDITENLELQEQIRKSDTLNVVGELAAGIAHEIRNPMTALKGFIQLLQDSVTEDFSNYFNVITSELKRIETIITEFLVLAKPQAMRYYKQDLNGIMRETVELLKAQALLHNIQFQASFEEEEFFLYCEGNQLKQVFINIIKNALEVTDDGGLVYIKVKREDAEHVRISIKDEGVGIPEEKIKKLGEPFYTTKERGTGLGLMVSYKIIEEHKGYVEVESQEGKGTTFHILLPLKFDYEEL